MELWKLNFEGLGGCYLSKFCGLGGGGGRECFFEGDGYFVSIVVNEKRGRDGWCVGLR